MIQNSWRSAHEEQLLAAALHAPEQLKISPRGTAAGCSPTCSKTAAGQFTRSSCWEMLQNICRSAHEEQLLDVALHAPHSARFNPHSARSYPHSAWSYLRSARSYQHSARSYPHSARSYLHSARSHPQSARCNKSIFNFYLIFQKDEKASRPVEWGRRVGTDSPSIAETLQDFLSTRVNLGTLPLTAGKVRYHWQQGRYVTTDSREGTLPLTAGKVRYHWQKGQDWDCWVHLHGRFTAS